VAYAEAAKQLRERKVNADVEKAVERVNRAELWSFDDDWALIKQHLRDQEAENARLRAMIGVPDGVLPSDAPRAITRAEEWCQKFLDAQARAEKADALLRECLQHHGVMLTSDPPQDAWKYHRMNDRITAHLGGEHE
jgi:hypothetical protein